MKGRFPRTYRNVKQCQTFMGCSYRTDGNVCLRPKCHSRIGWAQARSQHAHSCSSVQHQAMPFERTDRCTICASPKPTLHQTLLVFIVFLCVLFVISVLLIECRVTPLNSRAFLGSRRHCYPYTFIACRCWARGQLSGRVRHLHADAWARGQISGRVQACNAQSSCGHNGPLLETQRSLTVSSNRRKYIQCAPAP
jgi:hypothetical protein